MVAIVAGCDDVVGAVGVEDVEDVDVEIVVRPGFVDGADAAAVHSASSPSLGVLWW